MQEQSISAKKLDILKLCFRAMATIHTFAPARRQNGLLLSFRRAHHQQPNNHPVNATMPRLSFKIFCSSVLPRTTTEAAWHWDDDDLVGPMWSHRSSVGKARWLMTLSHRSHTSLCYSPFGVSFWARILSMGRPARRLIRFRKAQNLVLLLSSWATLSPLLTGERQRLHFLTRGSWTSSIYLSVCLPVCLSVRPSIHPSIYRYQIYRSHRIKPNIIWSHLIKSNQISFKQI